MSAGLKSADDIAEFLGAQTHLVAALEAVARFGLPDGWIAAGFIRNLIWDVLHDRPVRPHRGDIDVVYFDADRATSAGDHAIEKALCELMPELDWSVKNQARMHLKNADAPYVSTGDAMMHWPETCTAIGARLRQERIELLAPFGVNDLLDLQVRPTPAFGSKLSSYRERVANKAWRDRWPLLTISDE